MIQVGEQYIDIDIQEVIQRLKNDKPDYFYKTIDTNGNYMVCCPFHKEGKERRPSMGILKKDGTCHCFTCDWVGSLPELISNFYGYDDFGRYGEKWLLKNFKSIQVEERSDLDLDLTRRTTKDRKQIEYVSETELDSYRYFHPYMYERKMTNEVIEKFDIGYDSKTDSITFPVRDIHGNCLFVARRSVHTKFFNYPSGVEKPLYGLYELRKYCVKEKEIFSEPLKLTGERIKIGVDRMWPSSLIVCESMIDAITCWVYCKPAVALNGLGNDLQFKQLSELPCRELILATDNDEAGMRARQRIARNVKNKVLKQYMFPEGKKDINDLDKDEFDNLQEVFM